jgi:hypothetical protein
LSTSEVVQSPSPEIVGQSPSPEMVGHISLTSAVQSPSPVMERQISLTSAVQSPSLVIERPVSLTSAVESPSPVKVRQISTKRHHSTNDAVRHTMKVTVQNVREERDTHDVEKKWRQRKKFSKRRGEKLGFLHSCFYEDDGAKSSCSLPDKEDEEEYRPQQMHSNDDNDDGKDGFITVERKTPLSHPSKKGQPQIRVSYLIL